MKKVIEDLLFGQKCADLSSWKVIQDHQELKVKNFNKNRFYLILNFYLLKENVVILSLDLKVIVVLLVYLEGKIDPDIVVY